MAKSSPLIRNLNRFFDRIENPVYLVSADFVITYANSATSKWLDAESDVLSGLNLQYRSSLDTTPIGGQGDNENERNFHQLCPPPFIFDSSSNPCSSFEIVSIHPVNAEPWIARVFRLESEQGSPLALVIVDIISNRSDKPAWVEFERSPVWKTIENATHLRRERTGIGRNDAFTLTIGKSASSRRLAHQIKNALVSASDLLISGPMGSGKEHLARTILQWPHRDPNLMPETIRGCLADGQTIQDSIKSIYERRIFLQQNGESLDSASL
ncbi:MAG: sigma 54-interacting transcriptional regulator, partial [Planctomycetota bacterium]